MALLGLVVQYLLERWRVRNERWREEERHLNRIERERRLRYRSWWSNWGRPYRRAGWEVDIRVILPDGSERRQRRKAPVASRMAAKRWGEDRERTWYHELTHPPTRRPDKEVPTIDAFAGRFVNGCARANRQKPSGIAGKETILTYTVRQRF